MSMGQNAREPDVGSSPSRDMHAPGNTTMGQQPSNPFVERTMGLQYNMALTYVTLNEQNARIYVDPFDRYVVKIADIDTPFNPNPWVNYQGDSYMGQWGERYVVTMDPEKVDDMGCKVASKGPTNPLGPSMNKTANSPGMDELFSELNNIPNYPFGMKKNQKMNTEKGKGKVQEVDMILVDRIPQDWIDREVYQDRFGIHYVTHKHPLDDFPEKNVLYGETRQGGELVYKDSGGRTYTQLDWQEILTLSYKGTPYFLDSSPRVTARPEETAYYGETVIPNPVRERNEGKREEGQEMSFRTTARGPTGTPSAPPWTTKRKDKIPNPGRGGQVNWRLRGHENIVEQQRPAPVRPDRQRQERGRDAGRRHEDDYTRRVRPSTLQKLVKKYDGTGDPYDHIAAFRQVVHAEHVTDLHTHVEGFGLTMEGKALSWFQTLEPHVKASVQDLEEDFISAFSKMGVKHNVVAKIYAFKQAPYETVRDCANRMKQYIARCPEEEKPSQKRLISLFLEGLMSKTLHAHLYALKHTSFNECCHDAMDYDDNFDVDEKSSQNEGKQSTEKSSETKELSPDAIAELVLKRMGQLYRPPPRPNFTPQTIQGPYRCGKCGGDHKTEHCTVYPSRNLPPNMWCDTCRWNYTHTTKDCNRVPRPPRDPNYQVVPQYIQYEGNRDRGLMPNPATVVHEQARPVLGFQPPPPGTTPLRYAEASNYD